MPEAHCNARAAGKRGSSHGFAHRMHDRPRRTHRLRAVDANGDGMRAAGSRRVDLRLAMLALVSCGSPPPPAPATARERTVVPSHAPAAAQRDEELRRFVSPECAGIEADGREACPFRGHVVVADDIPGGVRLQILEGESLDRALQQMRCHVAFARASGRTKDCPLYLPGVAVRRSTDGLAIDVTSENAETVRALRAQFRRTVVL
jgi:hypothetical protein